MRPLRVQHRPMRAGKVGVDRLLHAFSVASVNGGMAYGTRVLRPRSFHSSQRPGKPATRAKRSQSSPSAKGSRFPAGKDVKVREMRRADTLLTSIQAWGKR